MGSSRVLCVSVLVAGLLVACGGQAPGTGGDPAAVASQAVPARYTAEQFFDTVNFRVAQPGGLAFSPDGQSLLISSDRTGVFNAYALPVAGGEPVALTTSTDNAVFAASWLPDGRAVVVSDQGGNELTHVYVREADGSLRDLTPGDKVKAEFLALSPDGRTLWLTSNARDPKAFDVLAFDTATLSGRPAFANPGGYFPADVSRDGRWLALRKPNTSADADVYVVDLQGDGQPKLVTAHSGNVSHGVYGFTPDSRGLVVSTDAHGEFSQAWTIDLASGQASPLLQADWDVMFVSFSPSGRYRVSAINADAKSELTLLDAQTGQAVAFTGLPDGDIGAVRFSPDEARVALTVASDTSPADVFVADLADGKARRLTTALNPAIRESDLVEATIVRYAGEGGVQVPAVLYKPRGASAANPVPAVVLVHGGPGGQTRRGYQASTQHLVNHGYAVLGANNRGSSGYGKTFFHMDDKAHGEADLRDIVAGGEWLRAQDWVADDQVAVMGQSYGGFMTAAALAFHPDAFEAGINIYGVTNWVRTLESIPAWWGANRIALYDEMGDPATDAERHHRISPLFHAGNIQRPLLVVQGANDPRVLQVESDELVAAVRANNVPVEYVLFPDEGHGFLRRENRISAQEAYLRFLDTHVRKPAR